MSENAVLDKIVNQLEAINQHLEGIDNRLDNMDSRLDNLEHDVKVIKLDIENDLNPKINLLLENQVCNSERFQNIEKDLRDFKDDVIVGEVVKEIINMQNKTR